MSKEKPASEEPLNLADLTMDLTRSFQPSWVSEAEAGKQPSSFPQQWTEESGGEGSSRRPSGRRLGDGGRKFSERADALRDRLQRQGPRKPGGERGGPSGRNEKQRREDGPRGHRGKPQRSGPPDRPAPVLPGWEVRFLPEEAGLEGLARQIKQTLKAFPLFQLARLILEKPNRYRLRFVRRGGPELLRLTLDQTLWLEEKEAMRHVLQHHLERFYRREVVTGEPPKGNFPCVAQCGMSGVLIGPPNHHDYQSKVMRLHAERFAHVPFAVYQSRIRMLRDEESIEKWRQEQATREMFFPLPPKTKTPATEETSGSAETEATAAVTEEAPVPGETETSPSKPAVETAHTAPEPEEQGIPSAIGETSGSAPAGEDSPEAAVEEVSAPETSSPVEHPKEVALSRGDLEKHFRTEHLPRLLRPVGERCTIPGPSGASSAPLIVDWLRGEFEKIQRFPLPLANTLSQSLHNRGCQIFKAHQNITYAAAVRPRFLNRQQQQVSDRLAAILDYLEQHAKSPKATQWKGLLAITPTPDGAPPSEENLAAREHSLAADLTWLLREGFVVDFANIGFQVTPAPRARETRETRPAKDKSPSATANTNSSPTEDSQELAPTEPPAETVRSIEVSAEENTPPTTEDTPSS
jgi:hypothetical protein